jgi:hypothetical protein
VIAKDAQGDIAALQMRLAELDLERERVLAALDRLKQSDAPKPGEPKASVEHVPSSSAMFNADKVALFRSLFRGREEIFPRRWENAKTGKSGYSPACANEWVRGICEKRIKCMECPNQAFIRVSDDIVRSHLQGRDSANPKRTDSFVAGVYPLMPDETCCFLSPISTSRVGGATRWRILRHVEKGMFLRLSSALVPVMAPTSGFSLQNRYRHPRREGSGPI